MLNKKNRNKIRVFIKREKQGDKKQQEKDVKKSTSG